MSDELAGGLAEQSGHPRADVADAVFGVDLPQPADTALLIFLEQQARALALAADVGIGLELVESPASDRQDTEDRYSKSEHDRQHVLERNRVATDQERSTDTGCESDHPGACARRDHDQAKSAHAEPCHDRCRNDLSSRVHRWKKIEWKAEPDDRAQGDLADHGPHRDPAARAPDAGDGLVARDLHCSEVHEGNGDPPPKQPRRRSGSPQVGRHDRGGNKIGRSEERREMGTRNQLFVAQRRAIQFGLRSGEPSGLTARKSSGNQSLIPIRSFVHPVAIPRVEPRSIQRGLKRG